MRRISFLFGTRPEAIKLCPLVKAMREHSDFEPHVCVTGQHREMLYQVLEVFDVKPDVDLQLMRPNQSLGELTARAIQGCEQYLQEARPQMVLVQGDTTTVFCAAMASFYQKTLVGHVEAGLRTDDKYSPYPEEMNRVLTSRLADYHFAPTRKAQANLLGEGIDPDRISVTGNTVVDALLDAVAQVRRQPPLVPGLEAIDAKDDRPLVLITGHRRENLGRGFEAICQGISVLAERFPKVTFVYPVHLNPNVRDTVFRLLADRPNIRLIEPLQYLPFVSLMDRCRLILTDSGGVQEEAPSLGKPVLVMRDTTERPEAVSEGTVRLIGPETQAIVEHTTELLTNETAYRRMATATNPYGDGHACERILAALERVAWEEREAWAA